MSILRKLNQLHSLGIKTLIAPDSSIKMYRRQQYVGTLDMQNGRLIGLINNAVVGTKETAKILKIINS